MSYDTLLKTPDQAIHYLKESFGITHTKSYLAKLRHISGGPVFHKIGHRVYYTADTLNAWVQARRQTRSHTSHDVGLPIIDLNPEYTAFLLSRGEQVYV